MATRKRPRLRIMWTPKSKRRSPKPITVDLPLAVALLRRDPAGRTFNFVLEGGVMSLQYFNAIVNSAAS